MAKQNQNNKNGNKNKTRGCNRNRKPREVEVDVEEKKINQGDLPHVVTKGRSDNDPSWYTHLYAYASDVGNFNYNIPVGTHFNPFTGVTVNSGDSSIAIDPALSTFATRVPGIMSIHVMPSIGVAGDATAAPNVAAQQLYTIVRKANSGAVNYDKTDLMMMILAMDSAYMLYEELLRAYRCIGTYNPMNRYQPNALLYALGYNVDLQDNLADFKGVLDLMCYQLGSINVPDQFDFITRHSWLFTNVYADAPGDKAQMYAYVPSGYFVWTEGKDNKPTYLKYVTRKELFGTDRVGNLYQIRKAINTLLQPLLGSADIGTMSGDLAKAFSEGGMIKFQPVSTYEAVSPVYSEEVLIQIMNSLPVPVDTRNGKYDITTNNEDLVSGPYLMHTPTLEDSTDAWIRSLLKHMINIPAESSVDVNLVATRNIVACGNAENKITACGTEIVNKVTVYVLNDNFMSTGKPNELDLKGVWPVPFQVSSNVAPTVQDLQEIADFSTATAATSAFDYAPTQYVVGIPSVSAPTIDPAWKSLTFRGTIQDIRNYTWIDDDTVSRLHDAALYSEFYAKSYPGIL